MRLALSDSLNNQIRIFKLDIHFQKLDIPVCHGWNKY